MASRPAGVAASAIQREWSYHGRSTADGRGFDSPQLHERICPDQGICQEYGGTITPSLPSRKPQVSCLIRPRSGPALPDLYRLDRRSQLGLGSTNINTRHGKRRRGILRSLGNAERCHRRTGRLQTKASGLVVQQGEAASGAQCNHDVVQQLQSSEANDDSDQHGHHRVEPIEAAGEVDNGTREGDTT